MTSYDPFPATYRSAEVQRILRAVRAGECVSLVGLSGAGKSNLLGFLAARHSGADHPLLLVDLNRLAEASPDALWRMLLGALGLPVAGADPYEHLLAGLPVTPLTLLLDRFDALPLTPALFGPLRALRDARRYQLSFVCATRHPLPANNEFAELVRGRVVWLGPLAEADARWDIARHAARKGVKWDEAVARALLQFSGGYPALLRAACDACADLGPSTPEQLFDHPAVRACLDEFWADAPTPEELRRAGLGFMPPAPGPAEATAAEPEFDLSSLTAKEHRLFTYLRQHAGQVCAKDDLIRAVWPEDRVFQQGVRDDSLAQLVRRLREKIEPEPGHPRHVLTVPGRGYRFRAP